MSLNRKQLETLLETAKLLPEDPDNLIDLRLNDGVLTGIVVDGNDEVIGPSLDEQTIALLISEGFISDVETEGGELSGFGYGYEGLQEFVQIELGKLDLAPGVEPGQG